MAQLTGPIGRWLFLSFPYMKPMYQHALHLVMQHAQNCFSSTRTSKQQQKLDEAFTLSIFPGYPFPTPLTIKDGSLSEGREAKSRDTHWREWDSDYQSRQDAQIYHLCHDSGPFKGHSSRLEALDYIVCIHSDVFVMTQSGNFPAS